MPGSTTILVAFFPECRRKAADSEALHDPARRHNNPVVQTSLKSGKGSERENRPGMAVNDE